MDNRAPLEEVPQVRTCSKPMCTLLRLTPSQPEPFRLLDLPPELWMRIIEMAVTKPAPLEWYAEDGPVDFGTPAVAKTSRAIRNEALKAFYKHNTFQVIAVCSENDVHSCQDWMEARMKEGFWSCVRSLQVESCCLDEREMTETLRPQSSGKKVNIKEISKGQRCPILVLAAFEMTLEDLEDV